MTRSTVTINLHIDDWKYKGTIGEVAISPIAIYQRLVSRFIGEHEGSVEEVHPMRI